MGERAGSGARRHTTGDPAPTMSRILVIAVLLFIGLLLAGALVLGAFPPKVHRAPVEHVVPNDRFGNP